MSTHAQRERWAKYVERNPVVVEAIHWTGGNVSEVHAFIRLHGGKTRLMSGPGMQFYLITTGYPGGESAVFEGDWIVAGARYSGPVAMGNEAFRRAYKPWTPVPGGA